MARKRDKVEEQLRALAALEDEPLAGGVLKTVHQALGARNNMVVARAVALTAQTEDPTWFPELVRIFDRFLVHPVKTDPGCKAKLAVVDALGRMEYDDPAVFLRGLRHVQMEPSWGPPVDTAATLRGQSLAGLVAMGYPDVLFVGLPLLTDPQTETRQMAAIALAHVGATEVELLLRMKVLTGDEEPQVIAECFGSLMSLNPERSLEFVGGYLDDRDTDLASGAALALGESRRPEAFPLLKAELEKTRYPSLCSSLALSMALLRSSEAVDYLLDLIHRDDAEMAGKAVSALGLFRMDEGLSQKVRDLVERRGKAELLAIYQKHFQG